MKYAPDQLEMMIEEYLGGRLAGASLAEFEREMGADGEIAQAVRLQRELDGALRAAFVPPAAPTLERVMARARAQSPAAAAPGTPELKLVGEEERAGKARVDARVNPARRWAWMALAAAVVLSAAGIFRAMYAGTDFKLVAPDEMYAALMNANWQPAQVCTTEAEFAALVNGRLGRAVVATPAAGVAILGWGYEDDYNGSPLSKKTMMLLTRVDEKPVLVLMDQARHRRELKVRAGSTLRVFEREVGGLVVYEVTPLGEARVIGGMREVGK